MSSSGHLAENFVLRKQNVKGFSKMYVQWLCTYVEPHFMPIENLPLTNQGMCFCMPHFCELHVSSVKWYCMAPYILHEFCALHGNQSWQNAQSVAKTSKSNPVLFDKSKCLIHNVCHFFITINSIIQYVKGFLCLYLENKVPPLKCDTQYQINCRKSSPVFF